MAYDDDSLGIDYQRLLPAEFRQRRRHLRYRLVGDLPGVPKVWLDPLDVPVFDVHFLSTQLTVIA